MNDNKITGAKNVLLLIVSGAQEITIDEIGEINDHIQAEAGYGANIIMGVGEDESLGEAVSVTIIATGFDVDQQNDITNTEVKKVVHALEDEQTMQHDLMPLDPLKTPSATTEIAINKSGCSYFRRIRQSAVTEEVSEWISFQLQMQSKPSRLILKKLDLEDARGRFYYQ